MNSPFKLTLGLALALALLLSCATVAPPVDFPIIPLPEKVEPLSIAGERVEGGVLIRDDDFKLVLRYVLSLRSERDALRSAVETYNAWAGEQRGKE